MDNAHQSSSIALRLAAFSLLLLYAAAFLFGLERFNLFGLERFNPDINGLFPFWFDRTWTTDDAVQQLYPFHKIYHPGVFDGDLITTMMESYLPPIHYWLSYGITWLTGDPVMMGHWVMLLQLGSSVLFMFLTVRALAGTVPGLFAVVWFLHTRHVIQRLTAGLPRGWAAPLFLAYLYCVATGRHRWVLLSIAIGCLLQPVAAFLMAGSYSFLLLWRWISPATRTAARRPLIEFVCATPVYAGLALSVVGMPPDIGTMVSYADALQIPEFQRPGGRFPFVPLYPMLDEIRLYGFHAFEIRYVNPGAFWRETLPYFVSLLTIALAYLGLKRRIITLPAELVTFGVSALVVYLLSRWFAFHLYVPDRHLRFPMAIFMIVLFTVGAWRACHAGRSWFDESWRGVRGSVAALCIIAGLVYLNSGTGLKGSANFNFPEGKYGSVFIWMRKHAPQNAVFAGHPTHMDPTQLFGIRRAYITTETAHPFYSEFAKVARHRLAVAFRAHYARTLEELVAICEAEGISHFVFARKKFYPEALLEEEYKEPHRALVRELVSRPYEEYAFRQLPRKVSVSEFPFMVYRDEESSVVDIAALKDFLLRNPDFKGARNDTETTTAMEPT